jgi:peptidoglycan/xylan/chitin deacetylase (PgdA/CDA1 family)
VQGSHVGPLLIALAAVGCTQAPAPSDHAAPPPAASTARSAVDAGPLPPVRAPIDGRTFPDKVLALTWDDGPEEGTLALAHYLRAEHVSATFFVVGAWVPGLSAEPGQGAHVFESGHRALPVLRDLVALGHRLGNHTENHVLLSEASPERVAQQLRDDQAAIDPFLSGGLRLFRAPGGAWNAAASAAVDADPVLSHLVGPVHWDIDGKDWEGSLYCRSTRPALECEPAAPGGALRVKPAVVAQRYLALAESVGHGIVLLHDRVGHVGSGYALRVAEALVPALEARGFVFAAPVLGFSPLAPHPPPDTPRKVAPLPPGVFDGWAVDPESVQRGDINGDGRADVCGRGREGIVCALSNGRSFLSATLWQGGMSDARGHGPLGATLQLADVNGDGRADLCGRGPEGWVCGMAP